MTPPLVEFASADPLLLGFIAGLLLIATVAGFAAGVACAPALREWAIRRATRHVQRLFRIAEQELNQAGRLCELLAGAATSPLETSGWERLDRARQRLATAWNDLSAKQVAAPAPQEETRANCATPFSMDWSIDPKATGSLLPDREAFETNLKAMLKSAQTHSYPCGLLLVRIDKCDQLAVRYGPSAVVSLQDKLAAVVAQSARDVDLVCRLKDDLYGVLLPAVSPLQGARHAEAIRSSVREHQFRLDDEGPAVLLTASFGYTACLPVDQPGLVIDRAREALDKSQTLGRNQLHVHDASSRVLTCMN